MIAAAALAAVIAIVVFADGGDEAGEGDSDTEALVAGPIRAVGLNRREIYHSPQTPGYTSWVGAWIMHDGTLMTSFTQVTGPVPPVPSRDWGQFQTSVMYLESDDQGRSWQRLRVDRVAGPPHAYTGQATIGLEDGTILRRVNGEDLAGFEDVPGTAYLQRLEAGANRWTGQTILLDPDQFTYNISRIQELSDGRLVATGSYWEVPAGERDGPIALDQQGWLLMTSADGGRTWADALTVPEESATQPNEWDIAELATGDLLAVMRTFDPEQPSVQVRRQALLRREGDGWVMEEPLETPFPHSGHPELLTTREGVILHIATSGVHYTRDGQQWSPLPFTHPKPTQGYASAYYPVAVQASDGEIYVFSHVGADDDYGERDQAILLDRFRLEPAGGESNGAPG